MENPSIWHPSVDFLAHFGIILTPFPDIYQKIAPSSIVITSFPCVPWFYDIEFSTKSGLQHVPLKSNSELYALESLQIPSKNKLISIILSSKSKGNGYQWRSQIASCLKSELGNMIDIYGFGHKPLANKRDGIDPYLITIVFENDTHPFYITEKLVDAVLGWASPIYCGSNSIEEILPNYKWRIPFGCDVVDAKTLIIKYMKEIVLKPSILRTAREKVMERLNLFQEIPRVVKQLK